MKIDHSVSNKQEIGTSEDVGANTLEAIPSRNNIVETSANAKTSAIADKILGDRSQCAETSARDETSDINDTSGWGETTARIEGVDGQKKYLELMMETYKHYSCFILIHWPFIS